MNTAMSIPVIMPETGSLAVMRLMSWLSPAFPVGAFAYSHGIEQAIHTGLVADRNDLAGWLLDLLGNGSLWNDAIFFGESHRLMSERPVLPKHREEFLELCDLAEALSGSRERHMETLLQGEAFLTAAKVWPHSPPEEVPEHIANPVAVGAITALHGIQEETSLAAYLHAFVSNLIQCAVRLVPLGQRDGLLALASMEAPVLAAASKAARSSIEDIGGCAIVSDIMSLRHEVQYSRVFRS